ncbi:MAG: HAMP domain-containing histidine kinase [Cyclobacteriaceae bacterium]|nr:HAMP domain-containing histidine kinase [Cyclobacteriaceae bacterium]
MKMSFKNRIALNYIVATAIMIAVVFVIIVLIVKTTVFYNLDKNLEFEAKKHTDELIIHNDSVHFANILEWTEREHREVQFYPVFIQLVSLDGLFMDKSPNLKDANLFFEKGNHNKPFNTHIKGIALRQIQMPIEEKGVTKGFMLAAVSTEEAVMVIKNLKNVLLLLYPLVLLVLFGVARYLAGQSIKPIKKITYTANDITKNNLNERIELPQNKDELYTLTFSINELLERIQEAFEREKQFTSDASHELRTPLAVLTGTLEVLIRKPRTEAEYKEKIEYSIKEIARMSATVDQLLMLARVDNEIKLAKQQPIEPVAIIDAVLERYKHIIKEQELIINVDTETDIKLESNPYYIDLIFDNLISNAVKYSKNGTDIGITFSKKGSSVICIITDQGVGISTEHLDKIFNPFFRAKPLSTKTAKGDGLGLSIVKKACESMDIKISIKSKVNYGTTVQLAFPPSN